MKYMHLYTKKKNKDFKNTIFQNSSKFSQQYIKKRNKVFSRVFFFFVLQEFAANGYAWDETICRKDSDGDGKSNGEELGDPNCVWVQGATPDISSSGHPGTSINIY